MSPRLRLAVLAGALAACAVVLTTSGSLSAGGVRARFDGLGLAGPIVFLLAAACLTVVLFPGPLLAGASGLLFGTALGTPVSIASATLGAVLAFCLSRWWARDAVERLAGRRLHAIAAWLGERDFLAVLYARLLPGAPYNLVNHAAGLAPIRLWAFALATALGTAPRTFAYVALGGSLHDLGSPEAIVAIAIIVLMSIGGAVALHRGLRARAPGPGRGSSSPAARRAGPP